ncbi:Cytochrome c551 peroxidase precursor [compost metagenome]
MISTVLSHSNPSRSNGVILKLLVVGAIGSLLFSCQKPKVETFRKWGFYKPDHFPAPAYSFEGNKQSLPKFNLGRELFYEPLLSSDGMVSCATCHAISHAFAGHNTALSAGVNNLFGPRNSPSIANMAWSPSFMWDGGINHIEVMPIAPLTNPVEMNETLANIVSKLQQSDKYKEFFKKAYGSEEITDQKLLKALTQYMMMIVSDNSKYDQVKRGEATFTDAEQQGYVLFQQKCSQCHTEPLFTDYSFRNNGLDGSFADEGRFLITQLESDKGKFKVPSLRNVALTYPYMHDGRYYTLNDVLNHYAAGIQHSTTLDPLLENGIPLPGNEKTLLIAFLNTLSDYELLNNSMLSEPKK